MLVSIGVPDTAGYFAKELDFFDTTVCLLHTFIARIDLREPVTPVSNFWGRFSHLRARDIISYELLLPFELFNQSLGVKRHEDLNQNLNLFRDLAYFKQFLWLPRELQLKINSVFSLSPYRIFLITEKRPVSKTYVFSGSTNGLHSSDNTSDP